MKHFHQIEEVEPQELCPGFTARMVHTDELTIAHVNAVKGSVLPEHQHPHEQVTNIISGTLEMTVGGETFACEPGTVITIPGNTLHSAVALTNCKVVDVFRPAREDYQLSR